MKHYIKDLLIEVKEKKFQFFFKNSSASFLPRK